MGDYKTHQGNPGLLRSDSMLKAIGKSINIRVSSQKGTKIPIVVMGNTPITSYYYPKSLSKDRKLWGNLLGAFLYESYRSMRRLRDDLFYRFRRGGYIELPDLDNRGEDIPIIFFASLPNSTLSDFAGGRKEEILLQGSKF